MCAHYTYVMFPRSVVVCSVKDVCSCLLLQNLSYVFFEECQRLWLKNTHGTLENCTLITLIIKANGRMTTHSGTAQSGQSSYLHLQWPVHLFLGSQSIFEGSRCPRGWNHDSFTEFGGPRTGKLTENIIQHAPPLGLVEHE